MVVGVISFTSSIKGVSFGEIGFPSPNPKLGTVKVVGEKGGVVTISVEIQGARSREEAKSIARAEATRVVNIISADLGKYVEDVTPSQMELRDAIQIGGATVYMAGTLLCFIQAADAEVELGEPSLDRLKRTLAESDDSAHLNMSVFRAALSFDDAAARFMALYRLLSFFASEEGQSDIDRLILDHADHHVIRSISPKKLEVQAKKNKERKAGLKYDPQFDETVYTRLRNEFTHRPGAPIEVVRGEMETFLPGLVTIARNAINGAKPGMGDRAPDE